MFVIYSLVYTIGFLAMLPWFIWNREKYLSGFRERFGHIDEFVKDGRPVVWVHCVSVGETNAARPLIEKLKTEHPSHRIVVSTVTKTGQELAREVFADSADLVFYFPFDWRFTVSRALRAIRPDIVIVLETEIWFNFFREVHRRGITLAIVNGRLSEKSARNYGKIPTTIRRVLRGVNFVLVQTKEDARRFRSLGVRKRKIRITGNIKHDQQAVTGDSGKVAYLKDRFSITGEQPLIVAASTHEPEEKILLDALRALRKRKGCEGTRMLIAPRHPERFDDVADAVADSGFSIARRSGSQDLSDGTADVILLDSIGELRSAYPLASIVFVGGSLIPHGGQNMLEPALEKKAIVTGPHLHNFAAIAEEFERKEAFVRLQEPQDGDWPRALEASFRELLSDASRREELGRNAYDAAEANRGATDRTLEILRPSLRIQSHPASAIEPVPAG